MVDVSQHTLVPEHAIVDEDELDAVLAEYDIKRTDLPKIKQDDPAVPADSEIGDVIKITRESRTADQAVVFRLVVQ